MEWAAKFEAGASLQGLHDEDGDLVPRRFDAYLEAEGVDVVLLVPEYSPRVTGIQPVEELLPLLEWNPKRFRFVANINPHLHYPATAELERQIELGAVGLKIHPVHGGFDPSDFDLYPAYALCEHLGMPVIFHTGMSIFPGAMNQYAAPELVGPVARDFPELRIVLAHGGRPWWYTTAASQALGRPNTWIEISGLPPRKLREYYEHFDLKELATKFIFGSDWPAVPGIRANALAIAGLGLPRDTLARVFHLNAVSVYRLSHARERTTLA